MAGGARFWYVPRFRSTSEPRHSTMSPTTPSPDDLLTAKEVAAILRIPPRAPYELGRVGAFPVHKIGGRWRVFRRNLTAYIAACGKSLLTAEPPDQVSDGCPTPGCPWKGRGGCPASACPWAGR